LVEDGVTGVLVPAGDAAALAAALAGLAADPDRRGEFSAAAAHRALQFDVSAMVERYAALFERVRRGETQCRAS
jgi:phosphatidylinositol alpha-mannosyltransferase